MNITTNNQPRPVLYWHDLTDKERAEFYHYDCETSQELAQFFRYKGEVYDLWEFQLLPKCFMDQFESGRQTACEKQVMEWHGYRSDSYFSGLAIRYVDDYEQVIVGLYTC